MFEKILNATDFSDVSKKALDYLAQLKEAGTKEIVLLHVIDEMGIETISRYGSGSADVYLSSLSNRMNEVMKVLTIIATIFIPLTFIAGISGMNFK
ncbi:MAG: hypothetical protein DRG87_11595 [Deltaproteobacteria bacterium]|nr:MAG: hypothetical protein DRG87_11595 [Deltaproteobacteria bacterium]